MQDLNKLSKNELTNYIEELNKKYEAFKSQNLKLDMSRGRPCTEQLNLSNGLLDCLNGDYKTNDGIDCRNYSAHTDGIPEAKELFASMLEVSPKEIIIGGNSSLNIMHDIIARALIFGVPGSDIAWGKLPTVKFLCPSPGYDRHFAICEFFNIEMINVAMKEDGPDMDAVEKLVAEDELIKGIWCVPKYSNPDGITYCDKVVDRFAKLKTKAKDFRIFWDNSYAVHHLSDKPDQLKNILTACREAGNPDRVLIFSSSSKISFAGSGLSVICASEKNINSIRKQISVQTIGPDKLNQLRHVRFFKNVSGIEEHMKKHAAILRPKFNMVLDILDKELSGKNIAEWNKPNGGYFISLNTMEGCARRVVLLAKEAGVIFTGAGATFPYGKDPLDKNIRIAPTLPPLNELKIAIELLCICIQLVSSEKLLSIKVT